MKESNIVPQVHSADISAPDVDVFLRLVQSGIERWVQAGKILCKAVESDPHIFSKIINQAPYLTSDILFAFKRMGEKRLYPYLLLDSSNAARRLAGMPYDEQVKLYGKPVKVAYRNVDGTFASYEANPSKLDKKDCDLVFAKSGVRTVEQQIEILRTTLPRTLTASPASDKPDEEPKAEMLRRLQTVTQELSDTKAALDRIGKPSKEQFAMIDTALNTVRGLIKSLR